MSEVLSWRSEESCYGFRSDVIRHLFIHSLIYSLNKHLLRTCQASFYTLGVQCCEQNQIPWSLDWGPPMYTLQILYLFFFFFGLPPSPFLQRVSPSEAQTMANPLVTLTAWYPVALVVAGMVCEISPLVPGSRPFRPPQSFLVDNSDRFEAVGVTNVVIGDKDMLRFE